MCLCGSYNGDRVFCGQIISAINELKNYATVMDNPSRYIKKGGSCPPLPVAEINLIHQVLASQIRDWSQT